MIASNTTLPFTISQMSSAEREKIPAHGDGISWTTDRILFEEPYDETKKAWEVKESYESEIEGIHHKPHYQFFKKRMESLQAQDIWLDAGCGRGVALEEYVKKYENGAEVYGVTLTKPDKKADEDQMVEANKKHERRLHLYFHDMLHFPTHPLQGRVSVITDIFGPFHYCGRPSEVLAKYAAMLKVGGTLFLRFGESNTVDMTPHQKYLWDKEQLTYGSQAFFFLYLATVRGFKILAPEDVSPASIRDLFSVRGDQEVRANKGYWDRSWILVRTEEPFNADPLYMKGENVQCDSSIASSERHRKYHWEISDKNRPYVEAMKEITL